MIWKLSVYFPILTWKSSSYLVIELCISFGLIAEKLTAYWFDYFVYCLNWIHLVYEWHADLEGKTDSKIRALEVVEELRTKRADKQVIPLELACHGWYTSVVWLNCHFLISSLALPVSHSLRFWISYMCCNRLLMSVYVASGCF